MKNLANRITIDPQQCGGRPCIRGMRIRVIDVLDLLANGLSHDEILKELPDLEIEDIKAVSYTHLCWKTMKCIWWHADFRLASKSNWGRP